LPPGLPWEDVSPGDVPVESLPPFVPPALDTVFAGDETESLPHAIAVTTAVAASAPTNTTRFIAIPP